MACDSLPVPAMSETAKPDLSVFKELLDDLKSDRDKWVEMKESPVFSGQTIRMMRAIHSSMVANLEAAIKKAEQANV